MKTRIAGWDITSLILKGKSPRLVFYGLSGKKIEMIGQRKCDFGKVSGVYPEDQNHVTCINDELELFMMDFFVIDQLGSRSDVI